MNFSEQLDKFVERGAEQKYQLGKIPHGEHHIVYKSVIETNRFIYSEGAASLKPIVLKLVEAVDKIISDNVDNSWEEEAMRMFYIAKEALAEIERMIGEGK